MRNGNYETSELNNITTLLTLLTIVITEHSIFESTLNYLPSYRTIRYDREFNVDPEAEYSVQSSTRSQKKIQERCAIAKMTARCGCALYSLSQSNEPLRRYGHSKFSKMAACRQLRFDVTGNGVGWLGGATGSASDQRSEGCGFEAY